jgi:DNA-binding NtrC family response regulator
MQKNILIADDESVLRESLKTVLEEEKYYIFTAGNGEEALDILKKETIDVVISDIKMPLIDGMELLEKGPSVSPDTFFMMMTAYASVQTAIEALRKGAYDYIIKPVEFDDLIFRLNKLFNFKKLYTENKTLRQRISADNGFQNIIGKSDAIKNVFKVVETVAATNSNILITGKSGTGKELVAKAIHKNSKRAGNIFLPVNCGAISENLIESELFGHRKGSFTGAIEEKQGLFKVAEGGTLFLDEIGDLPLHMQVKLLRAIEDKKFLPVGGTKPVSTDVRIIAATNQDLFEKTKSGDFREDLYYRLNVVEIKLPSLNERKEDIPLLVNYFIEKYCNEMGKKILGVNNDTMKALTVHSWRGGIRELENVIERAVIFAQEDQITLNELPESLRSDVSEFEYPDSLKEAIKKFEFEHIMKIMKKFDYNKELTAEALNIGLSSLYRKMEDLGIPTKINEE